MTKPSGAQAVDRALDVLELFEEPDARLTITAIAAALGVHRSTASRLVAALARHRLLEHDGRSYALGLGLVSLAGHVLNRFPVRARAADILRDLRDATGETVYLGVADQDELIYIDQAPSPDVRLNVDWVGRRQRLTAGITGAVILAFAPAETMIELVRAGRSEGDHAAQHLDTEELARIRRTGYLARYDDPSSNWAVVAVPIRDRLGEVVAAVCLDAPHHRVNQSRFDETLVPSTIRAGAHISERLGYTGQHLREPPPRTRVPIAAGEDQ